MGGEAQWQKSDIPSAKCPSMPTSAPNLLSPFHDLLLRTLPQLAHPGCLHPWLSIMGLGQNSLADPRPLFPFPEISRVRTIACPFLSGQHLALTRSWHSTAAWHATGIQRTAAAWPTERMNLKTRPWKSGPSAQSSVRGKALPRQGTHGDGKEKLSGEFSWRPRLEGERERAQKEQLVR